MQAWTESGNVTEHPEPWGIKGTFSTLRLCKQNHIPFLDLYINRLIESAKTLQLGWYPNQNFIKDKLFEYISQNSLSEKLIRICLFEKMIGISDRAIISDSKPVEGWLMNYKRPIPSIKSTFEKELYGRLSELDLSTEDWIIKDPKDNEIRETATSNLIFVRGNELIIPEKKILQGIVINKLIPELKKSFTILREIPKDYEISQFSEILLCGTGRGVAPLQELSELGWSSNSNEIFLKVRSLYNMLISLDNA